jgi:hypothetical protein
VEAFAEQIVEPEANEPEVEEIELEESETFDVMLLQMNVY